MSLVLHGSDRVPIAGSWSEVLQNHKSKLEGPLDEPEDL